MERPNHPANCKTRPKTNKVRRGRPHEAKEKIHDNLKNTIAGGPSLHWYKHQTRARHDPFIWDLRKRFGGEGYFVYFATLEIYADSFKPSPGWFLDVSVGYLKHELGIYHRGKLDRILEFIRSWPDVDRTGYRPTLGEDAERIPGRSGEDRGQSIPDLCDIVPKWVVNLSKDRISILIPNFAKIMDEYTRKKIRKMGEMSGHSPDIVRHRTREDEEKEKKKTPRTDFATVFRDVSKAVEVLADFPPVGGRRFPGRDFVGHCIKRGFHPGAIRDATEALIVQWPVASRRTDFDPWAYAFGTVKSRAQFYEADPVDKRLIRSVFGGFFNG